MDGSGSTFVRLDDISDLKQTQARLQQQLEEVQRQLQALKENGSVTSRYRLADGDIAPLWLQMRRLAERQLAEVEQALESCQPAPSRLAVDPSAIAAASLEAIGKRLVEQARLTKWAAGDSRNQMKFRTRLAFLEQLNSLQLRQSLQVYHADPYDAFLAPAGRVHALGPGILVRDEPLPRKQQ